MRVKALVLYAPSKEILTFYSCLIIPAAWNGRNLEAWDLVMRFVLDDNFFRMSDIKVLECTLMITHPKKPLLFSL